jgi:hypothetical protein
MLESRQPSRISIVCRSRPSNVIPILRSTATEAKFRGVAGCHDAVQIHRVECDRQQ